MILRALPAAVLANQVAKVGRWSERQVALAPNAPGKPVVIGIWDSGTDYKLFKATNPPGIAFDRDFKPTGALVRPMGEAEPRMLELKRYIQGAMDMRAAIDSPDARALKQRVFTPRRRPWRTRFAAPRRSSSSPARAMRTTAPTSRSTSPRASSFPT